jgi:hypothetical protein
MNLSGNLHQNNGGNVKHLQPGLSIIIIIVFERIAYDSLQIFGIDPCSLRDYRIRAGVYDDLYR